MAEHGTRQRSGSGPGNKQIATTFLESLAVRGQAAARERAMRALGLAEAGLADAKSWLADDAVARMFAAADTDPSLARSVGHRLLAADAVGIPLYRLGLATPEKAYRRIQTLLPRDRVDSSWIVGEMGNGSARLEYHEGGTTDVQRDERGAGRASTGNGRGEAALCALRVGMLEAVPGLFGLIPADVKESSCLSKGADACRYEIHWQRNSTAGLATGTGFGLALAVGFGLATLTLGPAVLSISLAGFCAMASLGLAIMLGRNFDLHRQLEAVAGARRGHLALFDQVDDALALKLDALARADAKLEGNEFATRLDRSSPDSEPGHPATEAVRGEVSAVAQKIHAAAGDLECWFEDGAATEGETREESLNEGRGLVREIRAWAAKMAADGSAESSISGTPVDVAALVARAIASARPTLPPSTIIKFEHDDDLIPIPCEPVQIEQVVVQLLLNAVEASRGLSEAPEVFLSLRKITSGIEFAVEDRGVGIEPSLLDELFDPFFGERRAGIDEGFGLPVCLRIVERHGGELRIEAGDRPGTRVSITLPESVESSRG